MNNHDTPTITNQNNDQKDWAEILTSKLSIDEINFIAPLKDLWVKAGKLEIPPQADPILWVMDGSKRKVLAAEGSIVIITSKAKGAKSALLGALMAGAVRPCMDIKIDTLGIDVAPCPPDKVVVHFDTESSSREYFRFLKNNLRRISDDDIVPKKLKTASLRCVPMQERMTFVEGWIETLDNIHAVFIDGLTDLIPSVNDENIAIEVVEKFLRLAEKKKTVFVFVVHENQKSTSGGGARGWIGSQLERKVSAHFAIAKNDDGTRAIEFLNCREAGEISPRLFEWNDDLERFISCGIGQIKKSGRPSKFSETEIEEMKSLKKSGQSNREIAKKFGVDHKTISKYMDSYEGGE